MKSPFDLGNEIKGLVVVYPLLAGCLPMGGLGSSCSSSKEYEQPPERKARLW